MRIPKDHVSVPSSPGDKYHQLYKANVRKDGVIELVPDGKENIQEKIDSWAETTDMQYILKQMTLGNYDVLNRTQGYYGDFTKAPADMREAMQMMIDAEREFYKLDLETRNLFDNDFQKWLATAGEEDWMKKMKFIEDTVVEKESEVKEDVS